MISPASRKPRPRKTAARKAAARGVTVAAARTLLLKLPDIEEARSYGMPAFKVGGRFFARFRDGDTVLVLALGSIDERDVLMQLEPGVFFFTEHYRNYPAVLIRLAEVPRALLADVLKSAWQEASAEPKSRPRRRRA